MSERDIPAEIKREVRQRCGFGCVICGSPLIEYDHIIDWAEIQEHTADNITLLCDSHHREKTNKLLTRDQVKSADADPYCIRTGGTSPFGLHFESGTSEPQIQIADDVFTYPNQLMPLLIDNIAPIIFLRDESRLLLNMRLLDRFNTPRLIIRENELIARSDAWDVELVGARLTIREQPRDIHLRLVFEPPNKVIIERAKIYANGILVLVDGKAMTIKGAGDATIEYVSRANYFRGPLFLSFGDSPLRHQAFVHQNLARYPEP